MIGIMANKQACNQHVLIPWHMHGTYTEGGLGQTELQAFVEAVFEQRHPASGSAGMLMLMKMVCVHRKLITGIFSSLLESLIPRARQDVPDVLRRRQGRARVHAAGTAGCACELVSHVMGAC
eukprot:1160295-Pelagomonas_calceolata.AAC.2